MKIKIIFIDIDGTIRNDKKRISLTTRYIIKKLTKKGIIIVICSGRNRNYTKNISLKCYASPYIISSNGADIYNYKDNTVINEEAIKQSTIQKLLDISSKYDTIINFNAENYQYTNKERTNKKILIKNFKEILKNIKIVQSIILDNDYHKMLKVKEELLKLNDIKIVNCSKHLLDKNIKIDKYSYFDLVNKSVSKGNAISKLCEYLKIDLNSSMAIGDSYNDISMFEKVNYSVAMGNSIASVKKHAKLKTDTNNNDGVYKILKDVLNNKI